MNDTKNCLTIPKATVTFETDELMTYGVMSPDGKEIMAAITGYNLNITFNMQLINSVADAEACIKGMSEVFYELLMEQLLEEKKQ